MEAEFVTSDLANFWTAFDSVGIAGNNPFDRYISLGSKGVKGFIPQRIISADSLLSMVRREMETYERFRNIEVTIREKEKEIRPYFYALKYWYPDAVYPPVYFVFGRFNSGGTISEDGLIIGAEKINDVDGLPNLIVHEAIHFQQKWPEHTPTLLQQSIFEGSADFLAELVTGRSGNEKAYIYGNQHEDELLKEFVKIMDGTDYNDWLYGTSGKDDRPNDLGYWIGYKIVEAYFHKAVDKHQAVKEILTVENCEEFLKASGFLNNYAH
ncbi:hypothetical protein H8S90_15630 [Olivibacter sp. SDN3]|uniref:DUF2268 domain-containing putative Zn-dependent protease n=1 Tax=Olivibacter sp. SDN3 TaxID=2764720 RepID=UPI001651A096|nr:DUF2268 domain-containing putative Zn-dependent protease [Olivibacter sp. SDN3]QNL48226.1 hypothetical protein H8S90_15630 [Olivibacter sp. SDN3]